MLRGLLVAVLLSLSVLQISAFSNSAINFLAPQALSFPAQWSLSPSRPLSSISLSMKGGNFKKKKTLKDLDSLNKETGSPEARYRYVEGGFEEKQVPKGSANSTSMYMAFDSALRASDYNMFCSPLKPVNAPTPFKSGEKSSNKGSAGSGAEVLAEASEGPDPEELRKQLEEEYQELDRLIGAETRGGMGGKDKRGKVVKLQVQQPTASSFKKQAKRQQAEKAFKDPINPSTPELDIWSEDSEDELSKEEIFQAEVEQSYEELQRLLGHKPKGRQKRRLDAASFTGNMTQHRADGMFKAVTLKDPLRRVYASRLKDEIPVKGSPEAVRRPAKPETGGSRAEGSGSQSQGPEGLGGETVDGLLGRLRSESLSPPAPQPPKPKSKARKGSQSPGGKGVKGSGQPKQEVDLEEGVGRLVLNHSTNLPGLVAVLQRLTEIKGVATVVPGRLSRAKGNQNRLALRVSAPTASGFKLMARKGTQMQEVFVVTDLEAETMEAAIAWVL